MRREGIALVLALATLVILSTLGTVIFVRTLGEIRHSRADAGIVQTLMLARGAAGVGGALLGGTVRNRLSDLVKNTANSTSCWAYGGNTNCTGESPDAAQVAQDLGILAQRIQSEVDGLICSQNLAPSGLEAEVRVRIHFSNTACGKDLPPNTRLPAGRFVEGGPRTGQNPAAPQTYALPFVLVAEARVKEYRRNLVLQGEYRFTVGRISFARYALFTNVNVDAFSRGKVVWFTNHTLFDGPVHTNGHFYFHGAPWFGGEVTSAGCTNPGVNGCNGQIKPGAYFYDTGFRSVSQMPNPARPSFSNWFGEHAPKFSGGVDWNAEFIPFPQDNGELVRAAKSGGLYFPNPIRQLRLSMKCLDASGTEVECTTPGATKWQYIEITYCTQIGCYGNKTKTEVYRYGEDGLLFQKGANGDFFPRYRFNGVIHTDSWIGSLEGPARRDPNDPNTAPPALAEFAQITVSARDSVQIWKDLKYERPPCTSFPTRNPDDGSVTPARCTDLGARNVLGVYARWSIWIPYNAPKDLHIHASMLSQRNVSVSTEYIPQKGKLHLLGSIIQYYYGIFGVFSSNSDYIHHGYSRVFAYDPRFRRGLAPPFFPTIGQDRGQDQGVVSVSLLIFDQREQVY